MIHPKPKKVLFYPVAARAYLSTAVKFLAGYVAMRPRRLPRSRNWCFTDFTCEDYKEAFDEKDSQFRYIGWGFEICPSTQRPHHQAWCQFENPISRPEFQRRIDLQAVHCEPCKGTPQQNDDYVSKNSVLQFLGKWISQGQRTDITALVSLVSSGASLKDISVSQTSLYLKYRPSIANLRQMYMQTSTKAFRHVTTTLVVGRTGAGKSRYLFGQEGVYAIRGCDLQWFDGYDGEAVLGIDEYANDVRITRLLALLDGYQLRLAIKCGFTYAAWTNVIITSNLHELHEHASANHRAALKRRITNTIECWSDDDAINAAGAVVPIF